jgi:Rieske Fe-S protein
MSEGVDRDKRRFLTMLTTGVGAVGAVFAATPFVLSMTPSARAKAAGAPVEADISKLELGQMMTIEWRGKPVWIVHRTKEMLDRLPSLDPLLVDPHSNVDQQPPYAKNEDRSASAPTSAARRCTSSKSARRPAWVRNGRADSSVPVTAPNSTSPAACSRTCPRRRTWWCRRTHT